MQQKGTVHPTRLSVDYPDRELNRLTMFFRLFVAIPILIVLYKRCRGSGSGATTMDRRPQRPRGVCWSSGLF
jgi:hypothetical protein